jgi:hypothetical protein
MCDKLVQLLIQHYVAIGLTLLYIVVAFVASLPEPGTWKESGGLYGLIYRWTHILANAPAAKVVASKLDIPPSNKYTGS